MAKDGLQDLNKVGRMLTSYNVESFPKKNLHLDSSKYNDFHPRCLNMLCLQFHPFRR